jgi:hypothetical protein
MKKSSPPLMPQESPWSSPATAISGIDGNMEKGIASPFSKPQQTAFPILRKADAIPFAL